MFTFVASVLAAGTEVTIRHVRVPEDLPALQAFFSNEFSLPHYRVDITDRDLRKIYTAIALSPYADAYIASVGDDILFLFEVHHARYYDAADGLSIPAAHG
ncbi:MAG: hypothetical protein BGO55_08575 [Sphingobacteriales bacterium 50-39]|nr:hypothetical protein [Sphingobacteriales bacterium]OJW59318.1 MAG: hypothetical protein BGO55_08575 [Sphingobacteriales bacterium 50-39]